MTISNNVNNGTWYSVFPKNHDCTTDQMNQISQIIIKVKGITCLVPGYGDNLSDVSEPQLELSLSSGANLRDARGEAGGRRLQTCA
jgi:hypothetical protein